jgi:hypothetical protein
MCLDRVGYSQYNEETTEKDGRIEQGFFGTTFGVITGRPTKYSRQTCPFGLEDDTDYEDDGDDDLCN